MKWKMTFSEYDPETGISKVWIRTDLGTFSGTSYLHEEDKDIASKFQGCKYAEMRAVSKYVGAKIKNLKLRYNALVDVSNNFKAIKNYKENKYTKILGSKIYNLDEQIKDYELYKKMLDKSIYYQMEHYRDELGKLKEKIEKNKKQEPTSK